MRKPGLTARKHALASQQKAPAGRRGPGGWPVLAAGAVFVSDPMCAQGLCPGAPRKPPVMISKILSDAVISQR